MEPDSTDHELIQEKYLTTPVLTLKWSLVSVSCSTSRVRGEILGSSGDVDLLRKVISTLSVLLQVAI